MMKQLKQAEQLLEQPITLDSLHEWDRLCKQAHGKEAEYIGDLYETLLNAATDEVYSAWMKEVTEQMERNS